MRSYAIFLLTIVFFTACRETKRAVDRVVFDTPKPSPEKIERGEMITGRVVQVADGDTILVKKDDGTNVRVRMRSIDAPELAQNFGRECRKNLVALVNNKTVGLLPLRYDKYQRLLAVVYLDQTDINQKQIEDGCAWSFKLRDADAELSKKYDRAQKEAEEQKKGLWQSAYPEPPWSWREQHPRGGGEPSDK